MDVDGVLTDGSILYDSAGNEQKRFHVGDGLGLTLLHLCGIRLAWISGRANPAIVRRSAELKIDHVLQGTRHKGHALAELARLNQFRKDEIGYIGDDWNDLPAFESAGVKIAVANAVSEVKAASDYVTNASGGYGAVREVCQLLLKAQGLHEKAMRLYLEQLQAESSGNAMQ